MTDTEIEQIIVKHYNEPLSGLMPLARELVAVARAKAYEEAAQTVAAFPEYSDYRNGFGGLVDRNEAADAVRALKDSLAQSVPTFEAEKPMAVLGRPPDSYSS